MGRLANIYRLGVKEIRSLWHDKMLFLFIVWAFTGGIYTAATSSSQELHNAPIAIVDEDRSALSGQIIDAFYGPYFKVPDVIDSTEIDPALDAGIHTFVLDIPPNFARDVIAGRRPQLQVNIDATRMSQAFIGAGYIQNIVSGEVGVFVKGYRDNTPLPIQTATRVKYNPNLTGLWFGGAMEIVNNLTMISIILTGAALIREREHGTLEHLLVMPLTASEIMLSKVWAMGLVVLLCAAFSLRIVVEMILAVPIAGSIPLFLAGAALLLFATTSLGIFMGTVARSMPQLGLLMILIIMPLQMLSGGLTPRESMPEIIQNIMLAAPTTHFVSLAQAVLYRGAGIAVVWPSLVAMTVIGCIFFLLALSLFRRSLAGAH